MTEREASLQIENAITEIERASAWLEAFAASADVPEAVAAKLLVAIDEVVNNIIRHGLPSRTSGIRKIHLRLRIARGQIQLTVTDDGPAFDPTSAAPNPADSHMVERQPGGVGLLFVQSLMDEIRYSRLDGCNRLVLSMRLPPPGQAPADTD